MIILLNQSDIKKAPLPKEKNMFSSQILIQAKLEQFQNRNDKTKLINGSAIQGTLERIISQGSKENGDLLPGPPQIIKEKSSEMAFEEQQESANKNAVQSQTQITKS
jgi:hypothetical protein